MNIWLGLKNFLIFYVLLVVCIFLLQRHLMYHPVKTIAAPDIYGLIDFQEVFITSQDGTKLQLWQHDAKPGYPTIVYFHGNASHLGDRAAKFSAFVDAGFGLVAVSYHGFGKSEGKPSEQAIYADARAAIDYATNKLGIEQSRLIYFGESLGTGVAVQMASERSPALLVLEAAYTSVETRSAELYPYLIFVRKLVIDKYDSLSKIASVHSPLLMLHGEQDNVIPIEHGRKLFAAANNPKEFIAYPDTHHADYSNEQTLQPLLKAIEKYGLLK